MKYVAIVCLVLGGLVGAWQRGVRHSRGDAHGGLGAVMMLAFAVAMTLVGAMQAGALVGKGGAPISAGSAQFAGFIFMLMGAGAALYSIWKYTPDDGTSSFGDSMVLLGGAVLGLIVLLAVFDVP